MIRIAYYEIQLDKKKKTHFDMQTRANEITLILVAIKNERAVNFMKLYARVFTLGTGIWHFKEKPSYSYFIIYFSYSRCFTLFTHEVPIRGTNKTWQKSWQK